MGNRTDDLLNDPEQDNVAVERSIPSFEQVVGPLMHDLHRCALAYTRNVSDAEDLVQETMLKAYKAFDRLRDDTHLKAWLLRIMRNAWISKYRADVRRPSELLTADFTDGPLECAGVSGSVGPLSAEDEALRHIVDSNVIEALLELSDDMRETVYHVAIEGMTCREAARIMGVSENTVLSRMHRIRKRLRESLEELAQQRGAFRKQSKRVA
jgi:RNA polymerase sigma-70 factor (ECF subfamily)